MCTQSYVLQPSYVPTTEKTLTTAASAHEKLNFEKSGFGLSGFYCKVKGKAVPLQWPRGFQEFKFPRVRYNGTGWW